MLLNHEFTPLSCSATISLISGSQNGIDRELQPSSPLKTTIATILSSQDNYCNHPLPPYLSATFATILSPIPLCNYCNYPLPHTSLQLLQLSSPPYLSATIVTIPSPIPLCNYCNCPLPQIPQYTTIATILSSHTSLQPL